MSIRLAGRSVYQLPILSYLESYLSVCTRFFCSFLPHSFFSKSFQMTIEYVINVGNVYNRNVSLLCFTVSDF